MVQRIDAVAVRAHMAQKTTYDLCEEYERLVKGSAPLWMLDAVERVLADRNRDAWNAWIDAQDAAGLRPVMPMGFFRVK